MIYRTVTGSSNESLELGKKIGRLLSGGQTIELVSDLGGGKTTMVQGIAAGMGTDAIVTSPTFTISRIYRMPSGLELHHFDFYRLDNKDIVNQELAEVVGEPDVVVAIEWAENAAGVLPAARLIVRIQSIDQMRRQIEIESTRLELDHIVQELPG